eukprot:GHVU01161477.1.p1 GENE.GHVU01161477.1~~GHVU01161477.1.p1  ORF type:complete len:200 (+),score=20.81 GHVU01161477.1:1127-1726(+)
MLRSAFRKFGSISLAAKTHYAPVCGRSVSRWTAGARCFSSSAPDISSRVDRFVAWVVGTNWQDYINLVQNLPFWEAEVERIETAFAADPAASNAPMQAKIEEMRLLMDCLHRVEDVRDHLCEIQEQTSRSYGIGGYGILAKQPVENFVENMKAIEAEYEEIKKTYPAYLPQIEDVLGMGLAQARQKVKFEFKAQHKFSF